MISFIKFNFEVTYRYLKKNLILLTIGVILGSLLSFNQQLIINFVGKLAQNTRYSKKIGIYGFYTLSNLPREISDQVTYNLTDPDGKYRYLPSKIIQSISMSKDNKEVIITLDGSFKWHDGTFLTSRDIKPQIYGAIITPISDDQLKITLQEAFSPINSLLSQPLFKNGSIGLGKFKIANITYRKNFLKSLTLVDTEKNDPPIEVIFYNNHESDLVNAFKLGEINQIFSISDIDNLRQWPNVQITPKLSFDSKYVAIFFNTQKLTDKKTRQAISYATPKTENQKDRCYSPISPLSWAYNPDVKQYDFNPTKAKEMYKTATPFETLTLTVSDPKLLSLAEQIKTQWQQILNINLNIIITAQPNINDFDLILSYGAITKDPDQYLFWHSTQKTNVTKINNPKIDKLLEEGRVTFDFQQRQKIYHEFQKSLLEEAPAIFISFPIAYDVARVF